jgi:phage baseplate assembly protein gpV/phage protein D
MSGHELGPHGTRNLVGLRVQQRCNVPALCELVFAEALGSLPEAIPGMVVRVGVRDERHPLFAGEVTAVQHVYEPDGHHELRVRAYDPLHRLRKHRRVEAHTAVSPADVASAVTAGTGLGVDMLADGPMTARLVQRGDSDLDILQDVCAASGLSFSVRDTRLQVFDATGVEGDDVDLCLGGGLREARFDVNTDPACTRVKGTAWDLTRMVPLTAEADQPRSGRRASASADPGAVGSDGVVFIEDLWAHDDAQLRARLQARLDRDTARTVTVCGVAEGNPTIRPGTPVNITGVAAAVAGRYVVTSVDHVVDQELGFVSEFSTEPPPLLAAPGRCAVPTMVLGRVVAVDDPDHRGRVRVALPTLADSETDWMPVLCTGAGTSKGLVCLPDVGDQVLLLAPSGNLANALVAGGLYGAEGPVDPGVEGGAVRRYSWRTPGGHCLTLDDAERHVRVDDASGNRLELGPNLVSIHAVTDLVIDAPGRGVRIRAKSIDFETAL